MSIGKFLFFVSVALFSIIGFLAWSKKNDVESPSFTKNVSLQKEASSATFSSPTGVTSPLPLDPALPQVDRIHQLFTTKETKFPIVETIAYSSSVSWLKGRPAWLADYAAYYGTSKHFISRGLYGKGNYFSQKVQEGGQFNVFKRDKRVEFHLVVDLSRLQLAFYYLDLDQRERVLLKVYPVGLGRLDPARSSGSLTPIGCYQLGEKISSYKPGVMGFFHEQKTEMIRIFGTRWIPFGEEISGCTEPAKGYGIHGAPWMVDSHRNTLIENRECVGKYESDGCIRLLSEDIEELFAIVVTKPTFIHIAKRFEDVTLPGVEVGTPSR